jgi:hypothetical protein
MEHVFGRTKITEFFLRIKLIAVNLTGKIPLKIKYEMLVTYRILIHCFFQNFSKKVFELFETLNLVGGNQDTQDGNKN